MFKKLKRVDLYFRKDNLKISLVICVDWLDNIIFYQTVELRDRALAARLTDVPDLHAALAASVDVPRGVADSYGAHHLTVAECVDLAGVTGNAWSNQSIWRKRYWLHLAIRANMERVGPIYQDMKEWDKRITMIKKFINSLTLPFKS